VLTQIYHQPNFYHFSQTTIEAARWVSAILRSRLPMVYDVCDLFAGSGVFSLELIHRLPKYAIHSCNMVELQPEFKLSLERNSQQVIVQNMVTSTNFYYEDCISYCKKMSNHWHEKSLLLLNPPHFFSSEGKLPKNKSKLRCHFIQENDWQELLGFLEKSPAQIFLQLRWNTQLTERTCELLGKSIKIFQPLSGNEFLLYIKS